MAQLVISFLGGFQITCDGQPINEFDSQKVRSLLAYLAVEADRPHTRETLSALLWPDWPQESALTNLRNVLAGLRRAISDHQADPPYLLIHRESIQFNRQSNARVDVWEFDSANLPVNNRRTGTGDPQSVIENLQSTISLYRGPFLAGFSLPDSAPFEDWLTLRREQLGQRALLILRQLTNFHEACGEYEMALIYAQRQVALEPWLEEAHRQIMRFQALSGQRSAALAQYETCKRWLAAELDLEPAEETNYLYQTIRTGQLEDIHPGELLPAPGEAPYKGLRFFDEADAALFFGREALVARLLEHIQAVETNLSSTVDSECPGTEFPLLAVVGASGSGKSSLVRAGLVPRLRAAGWDVSIVTPGEHPASSLAPALWVDGKGGIIVIDQFEELFTLCRDESERLAFIESILAPRTPCQPVILTLRADFYGHCAQYPRLRQALCARQEYIGPMSAEELRRSIETPAWQDGWEFEPGLVELILQDTGASGDLLPEPGALPLLEHALLETWKRRRGHRLTLKGYAEAGGVRGAIAKTAESVFFKLSIEQQTLARRIFLSLTELGEGTQDTRRRAHLRELSPTGEASPQLADLLKVLVDARLITLSEDTAEVAHEALIREWPTLRQWLSEDREGLLLHRHLTQGAQEWERDARDPAGLYRGARLAQAQEWAASHGDLLNLLEKEFLTTSRRYADQEMNEREAQAERELEQAHRLVRAQIQRSWILLSGLLVAVLLGVLSFSLYRQASENAATAVAEEQRANQNRSTAQVASTQAVALQSTAEIERGRAEKLAQIARGRQVVAQSQVLDPSTIQSGLLAVEAARREAGYPAYQALHRYLALTSWSGNPMLHERGVSSIAFNSDRTWVVSGSWDGTVRVWNAQTGQEIARRTYKYYVISVAFSPDGQRVVAGNTDGTAHVWGVQTGQEIARMAQEGDVTSVAFSPDGQWVVTGSDVGAVQVWNAQTGQAAARMIHQGRVNSVTFSPDGQWIVSGGADGSARTWNAQTGQEIGRMSDASHVNAIAFSPDGQWIVAGRVDGTASVRNVQTGLETSHITHDSYVTSVAFSPDGQQIVSGSWDGALRVWNAQTGQETARMNHEGRVISAAFSPDGRWVVAGHTHGAEVRVWNLQIKQESAQMIYDGKVNAVAFSPDGLLVVAGSADGTARVWNLHTGKEVARMTHPSNVTSVAFSPDGQWVVSGSFDGTVCKWNAQTGEKAVLKMFNRSVNAIVFSPNGQWVALGYQDGTVHVWNAQAEQNAFPLTHKDWVSAVAFSPDGQRIASGSWDGKATVWNAQTGEDIASVTYTSRISSIAFSPDGLWVVSGSADGTACVWNAQTGQRAACMLHEGRVNSVAFSPDGQLVITGSGDGTARIWAAQTGEETPRITHGGSVNSVAFSPDGQWVASGSDDGTLRVWKRGLEGLISDACHRLPRNFTESEWQQYFYNEPYRKTCPDLP